MDPDEHRLERPCLSCLDGGGKIMWFRVTLNWRVLNEIERIGGCITFDPVRYEYPRIEWWARRSMYLHRFVYEMAHPGQGIPKDHIVHHFNEDKFDATIENLVLLDRRAHALLHLKERKVRKFAPHPKGPSERRPPSKIVPVSATKEQLQALAAERNSERVGLLGRGHGQVVGELVQETQATLAGMLPDLRLGLPWLFADGVLRFETARHPRWDSGKTWLLGLKKPRLQPTEAEEALVLLMVACGHERAAVAARIGVAVEVVSRLLRRPAVAHALDQLAKSGLIKRWPSTG